MTSRDRDTGSIGSSSSYRSPPPRQILDSAPASCGSSVASTYSGVSVTSAFRHENFPFAPSTPTAPKPVLTSDEKHRPRTRGSVGLMIVGLGGANATTLLAGILANRLKLQWRGPRGEPMTPNYNGCITQINQRGKHGGVGFRDKIGGLADASMAAIGGWDIRPQKPGDALLAAQILDYDLVRQIRDDMNRVKIFRGLYDPRFTRSSQHDTATHILTTDEAPTDSEALKCLRADIRYFKWRNGVVGHTSIIWSATSEPNCEDIKNLKTSRDLLEAIEMPEDKRGGPLPPSILYATAALLEGCSFINGGSQNTLSCPGLVELARQQLGVYCLGTYFRTGQTCFKMATVEYLRALGHKPKVISSSEHLGNNDMKNLASEKWAKSTEPMLEHDLFAPWEEKGLDHKANAMYNPFINDEKRGSVEYTSLGFLGQPQTMVTYTRASNSLACAPLMIDAAVWCDFFAARSWPFEKVGRAAAYLFQVPDGVAKDVDPGFFKQMDELNAQATAARDSKILKRGESVKKRRVRIRPEEKTTEWAIPHDARIICAGLACVDMQLNHATGGGGGEGIETFQGEKSVGGGSVSMACKTLARLCHGPPLDDGFMQVTPPAVHSVIPICKVGNDDTGDKLISLLEDCGSLCRNVETKYIKAARVRDVSARTALAVLPIFEDGRRGCFFDAASNTTFAAQDLVEMLNSIMSSPSQPDLDTSQMSVDDIENYRERLEGLIPDYGAFLFGYPHLLPRMQGESLAQILLEARSNMIEGGLIALDLNGVPGVSFQRSGSLRSVADLRCDPVIGMALEHVDILHMNEEELTLLTGCKLQGTLESTLEDEFAIASAINLFLMCGVGVVAVTRGRKGSIVSCNDQERFRRSQMLPSSWADCTAKGSAVQLPPGTVINSNGAGDSFTAGLLVAAMLRHTGMTVPIRNGINGHSKSSSSRSDKTELDTSIDSRQSSPTKKTSPKKKLTPYTLYMRENYVTLKKQCNDDKKAIFSMCHEMWENESDEVKSMYERKVQEENEAEQENELSIRVMDDMEKLDSTKDGLHLAASSSKDDDSSIPHNLYMTNRSLNLESAVLFASLVAAYHIDINTRDRKHIDMSVLLERALVAPTGLEEI